MCREEKKLCKSHLMPHALYALCRTDEYDPVRLTEELMLPTSRQTMDHLLCFDCEQNLSRNGESWLLPSLDEAIAGLLRDPGRLCVSYQSGD